MFEETLVVLTAVIGSNPSLGLQWKQPGRFYRVPARRRFASRLGGLVDA